MRFLTFVLNFYKLLTVNTRFIGGGDTWCCSQTYQQSAKSRNTDLKKVDAQPSKIKQVLTVCFSCKYGVRKKLLTQFHKNILRNLWSYWIVGTEENCVSCIAVNAKYCTFCLKHSRKNIKPLFYLHTSSIIPTT